LLSLAFTRISGVEYLVARAHHLLARPDYHEIVESLLNLRCAL
jgi:hypothetical protein